MRKLGLEISKQHFTESYVGCHDNSTDGANLSKAQVLSVTRGLIRDRFWDIGQFDSEIQRRAAPHNCRIDHG